MAMIRLMHIIIPLPGWYGYKGVEQHGKQKRSTYLQARRIGRQLRRRKQGSEQGYTRKPYGKKLSLRGLSGKDRRALSKVRKHGTDGSMKWSRWMWKRWRDVWHSDMKYSQGIFLSLSGRLCGVSRWEDRHAAGTCHHRTDYRRAMRQNF